jgi:hypothetical protein
MPIYSVQGPDGRIYDVEGPAGASEEQILGAVRRQFLTAPAPAPEKKGSALGDIARSFGLGAVGATKAITSAAGADNEAARALGRAGESLQEGLSASRKAELQKQAERMKKAEESGSTLQEIKAGALNVLEAPLQSAAQAVGSFAPLAPTIFLAKPLAALGLGARAIMGVRGAIGGAQGAGAVKQSIYDTVLEAEKADGKTDEQAAAAATRAQSYISQNADQILLGTGLGVAAGTTGVERILPGGVRGAASKTQEALAKRLGARTASGITTAAAEMPLEGLQGGQERLAANLALQRTGRDVDAFTGVAGQATQEALTGALGAGPIGALVPDRRAEVAEKERQQKEQADAAAAAEAAKNSPEALRQLDTDFRAADQQLKALNAQLNATKPKKGATDEQKQAYEALKAQRDELLTSYKPLRQEFQKRKGAIDELQMAEQTALETAAAQDQTAAKLPLPSDIPGAQPFQLSDTSRLMNDYDTLRGQVATLEQQLAAGPDLDTQTALTQQRGELMARMSEMAPVIEERGGVTDTAPEFAKKMAAAEKERLRLLEIGDFDAAAKQAEKVRELQARAPYLQELNDFRTKAGQNRDLFTEMPEQPEGVGVQYAAYPKGKKVDLAEKPSAPVTPFPATATEAAPLPSDKPEELATVQTAQTGVTTAQQALDEAVKTKDTTKIFGAVDALNQAQNTVARAQEDVGRPLLKPTVLDIFSPANLFQTAFANNDTKLLNDLASHADTTALRTSLNQNLSEREILTRLLDTRLDLGGEERAIDPRTGESGQKLQSVKRERADLFSKLYDVRQQALFKNGQNLETIERPRTALAEEFQLDKNGKPVIGEDGKPVVVRQYEKPVLDKNGRPVMDTVRLQDIYDQGGPAAVEYERVMQDVADLSKKVTTKQGNAKKSLYEQLVDLSAQHSALVAQMESGIATPNLREKTAGLQAKLGKGEAPAERQMDAKERSDLQKKIDGIVKQYKLVEGKVAPIRDQITTLYSSLYKTTPLEKASTVAARKARESDEAAKGPKAVSRTAKTAARIAKGDVRKEAETSKQMRDLALELGKREPEYARMKANAEKRLAALENKYGKGDPQVRAYSTQLMDALEAKAVGLGKQTPEYKATLKEQTEYVKGALAQSKQTVPTKRTGQVTRKQSAAPSRLVTSSPESRAQTDIEDRAVRIKRGSLKDFQEALDSEKYGTAYRLKEGESDTVVDAAEAQKVIDGLKLPDNVKFVYAPTARQVPVKLLNQMAADGIDAVDGVVRGAVFPDGTVLVVGDQHADVKDLEETIAHELIGHYGIDTLIGSERLNAFAKKTDVIALAEQLGGKPLVSEVMATVRANAALGRSEEVQKLQALREIIAHTEEARVTEAFREKAGRWLKELVGMVRAGLRDMGFKNLSELSTSDVFYMLKRSRKAFANKTIGPYRAADGGVAFRLRKQSSPYTTIGGEPGIVDTVVGNMLGLAGRVQFIDQYAALDAATKKGLSAGVISSLEATNINYLLRFGQQRSQFAGQFLTNGPVKAEHVKKAGGVETLYRSTKGVSMVDVAKKLNEAKIGNDTEQEAMFTLYMAGKRANQVGWDKLNVKNSAKSKDEYNDVMARLNAKPEAKKAFEDAAKLYKEYNAGLMDFLVDTGALTPKKAAELKSIDYVPFYRINANGEVQLMVDRETPVRIANIKDQPQLKELVGGNDAIMPIFTSAAQNTFMVTGMGLRNQAVKETAFMLQKLGIASRVAQGKGPASDNVVRFLKNGEQYYASIDTDAYGIPAELIVRGMEGIKTTLPAVIKLMGIPANILRSFVVRNPTYAVRQIIRDPLNAWLTTGTDAVPVLSSMKELAKMVAGRSDAERKLMETGAISSNVYSGDDQDMAKFLKDMSAGKSGWDKATAMLDTFALQGDAATRAVIYKDSLAKGMSEQEALLRTLESMNFSRRGVSPSMQALSTLIPFFNAQVQGLDVIYRAFKGDMPYSQQLDIRGKMLRRGALLAGGTMAYAMLMQDDEAYKRAKPEERLANWFVYVPGIDEPVRVPIPFEMGFLFKALPEAIYNMAMQDDKADAAIKGLGRLAAQTVPLSLPQAVKPLTEAVLGKSFYSGDIESSREKDVLATQRYRDTTTELSKMIGAVTGNVGVSPITLDYLIRGYTGGLGIALVQLANPILAPDTKAEIAEPTTKVSKTPFIGGLFQPVQGRGTLDEAYDRMTEIRQVKGTFNDLVSKGNRAEAMAFAQEYSDKLAAASLSGSMQKRLGELAALERQIKAAPNLTTEQKDAQLERLDKAKTAMARQFLAVTAQR